MARLYERRRRWEVNREALLDEEVSRAPLEPHEDFAYLHLVARPVVHSEDLLDRAKGDQHAAQFLNGLFSAAASPAVFSEQYSPDLSHNNAYDRRADGWAVYQGLDREGQPRDDPSSVLELRVDLDGTGHLFCGRAAERHDGRFDLFEVIVAGLATRFMSVVGGLYRAGNYHGPVDVGLAVTGLEGVVSYALRSRRLGFSPRPYDRDEYRRTGRFMASTLRDDPRSAARKLVLPLVRATTQERYDPFSGE